MMKKNLPRDFLFALLVFLACLGIAWMPDLFVSSYKQQAERVRGSVVSANNDLVSRFGLIQTGDQILEVRLLEGLSKGQNVTAVNSLVGKMEMDKFFQEGDEILLVVDRLGDEILSARAYDFYRMDVQILLFFLFVGLLVLFAGWTGLKAVLSFVFAVLLVWKILIPNLLMGVDPILLSLGIVALLTAVTMILVSGITRTASVATIGALLGVGLTAGLAMVLFPPFRLHGAVQPFAESLLYAGFPELSLDRLFMAAVIIGASGAVMDLAIDVAASMNEVANKRPDLSFKELVLSGFAVGRAMTSTMVTTLLMAYISGYLALLMLFLGQGIPPLNFINTAYISAEVLKTLVGSFGLVTVAPFTALVGGLIFLHRNKTVPGKISEAPQASASESPYPAETRIYTIAASHCALRVGDQVAPDTLIGIDHETGITLYAGVTGMVHMIQFNGKDHALNVLVDCKNTG